MRIGGQQQPAIRIQVDPAKLVEKNLQLEDVRSQIASATVDNPKGSIIGDKQSFTIFDNDQLTEAKPWNDVIVAYRNGAPVRVRDIGVAVAGPVDTTAGGVEQRQAQRLPRRVQAARRQRHQDRREHQDRSWSSSRRRFRPTSTSSVTSDRTTTIRASVEDVQFTLMLTIALVVMVIFVFLRSVWATIIPSITVPLALLGACALMWSVGYSLDNLSLMALTIAVGFVVDDAIVMLENITRHIEEGTKPFAAALKGASEIGFTIVSISVSLIAVLIPLLLMSGIIGRLFREFAVTMAMTIVVSAIVALTLTPMMASRFLKSHDEEKHGRLYKLSERGFVAMARGYERGLDFVLRHRFVTLLTFIATVVATGYLFVIIPKGFFPQQDTGILFGVSEAGQDVSFPEMYRIQQELGAVVQADPAVATIAMGIGAGVGSPAQNNGRMFITLKPLADRDASVFEVIRRLRPKLAQVKGARLYLQAAQDVTVGARAARTQFQYTIQDANLDELNVWAPRILGKLQSLPELRDVNTDQQVAGTTLQLTIDRDMASRFGIQPQLIDDTLYDAFGQRQVAQYFTQINTYYVVEEVTPSLQGDPATLGKIYIRSPATGQMVPLSAFAKWTTNPVAPLSISHQGQFPAITISFNLANGVALGTATAAIQDAEAQLQLPRAISTTFQGNAQAFQDSLTTVPLADPRRAGRRLYHPRRALRELHPSADDSLDVALGGFRRARDPDDVRLRIQPDRADRHDPADRHRQEERHHDGRLRDRRRARRRPLDGGIDPQGGADALPADHDDHHGGAAGRRAADAEPRHRLGAAPAARLHHGRRPDRQPGADPVHDAGGLSLSRPAATLALRRRAPRRSGSRRRRTRTRCLRPRASGSRKRSSRRSRSLLPPAGEGGAKPRMRVGVPLTPTLSRKSGRGGMLYSETVSPVRLDRTAAWQSRIEARLPRAEFSGSRSSSIAHSNSPIAPAKPSLNQLPSKGGPRDAGFGVQFDRLRAEVRPAAGNRAARADDDGGILRPIARVAVECQRGLPAGERHERLREQGRPDGLPRGPRRRRMDAQSAVADHADEEIKPMDAEIPQHEIVDRLERRCPISSRDSSGSRHARP